MTGINFRGALRVSSALLRWVAPGMMLAIPLVTAAPVNAADRISRGDVEAVFQAFGNGGKSILGNLGSGTGAPADVELRASIRPFEPWGGRHYCQDDWHLLVIADIEPSVSLLPTTFSLFLDGALIPSEITTPKRFFGSGGEELYFAQGGAFFAPGKLAVGAHTFSTSYTTPLETFVDGPITFYLDPSGTGACL